MSKSFHDIHEKWLREANKLIDRDYEVVSKLLLSQLLIEHYITKYLERQCPKVNADRMSFFQKANKAKQSLVRHPTHADVYRHFFAATDCLRLIRNKLVHNISYVPSEADFEPLRNAINAMIDILFDDPEEAERTRPKRMGDEIETVWGYSAFMCGILHFHTLEVSNE